MEAIYGDKRRLEKAEGDSNLHPPYNLPIALIVLLWHGG